MLTVYKEYSINDKLNSFDKRLDRLVIVDLLRYNNFVICYTESYPQRIT